MKQTLQSCLNRNSPKCWITIEKYSNRWVDYIERRFGSLFGDCRDVQIIRLVPAVDNKFESVQEESETKDETRFRRKDWGQIEKFRQQGTVVTVATINVLKNYLGKLGH